jgi:hypothetical protein
MTDHHNSPPEPGDDPVLDEAFSHLKRLEPPLETRIANRVAVATALGALDTLRRQRPLPWWRRSISVPIPIAASLAALVAFVLVSGIRDWQERPMHADAPKQVAKSDAGLRDKQSSISKHTQNARAELKYYETETYLCGIGRVSSESHYFIEE